MTLENYEGKLLVATPTTAHEHFQRGLLLVVRHTPNYSTQIQINKPVMSGMNISTVMQHSGINYIGMDPVYWGGPDETNRIFFVHTLDWQSTSTRRVTDQIGVTSEISILAAISTGNGPNHWRCCLGRRRLKSGFLEGEMSGDYPWTEQHRWLSIDAKVSNTFHRIGDDQWLDCVEKAADQEVKAWF